MRNSIVADDWEIVAGYPDFFNNANSTYLGYAIINSENGTGGKLGMRMTSDKNSFEAVETKLTKELVKGEKYLISIRMSQMQYANYSMDLVPFILSNERVTKENIFKNTSQNLCILQTNENYVATDGWKKMQFIYEAKGGEKYFTLLNNTYTPSQIKKSKVNKARFSFTGNHLENSAYYFFDEISIQPTTEETACSPMELKSDAAVLANEPFDVFHTKLQTLSKLGLVQLNASALQEEELLNKHTIFLIDISGSMKPIFSSVQKEVKELLNKIPENQLVSLVIFNDQSQIILGRDVKTNLQRAIDVLIANGETNVQAGFQSMNSLIDPTEMTYLEIFSDQTTIVSDALDFTHPNKFKNIQNEKYYLKYESILTSEMVENILNESKSEKMIRTIYESQNPTKFLNFKKTELPAFQFSKECSSIIQNEGIQVDNNLEKTINNVYLIDVSASMGEANKLIELKKSLLSYNAGLNTTNHVSLVSFAATIDILVNSVSPSDPIFNETLEKLQSKGATKINDGIKYIYSHYTNRMNQNLSFVLFTDGQFVLSQESERIIRENLDIHLSIFQFGDRKNKQLMALTKEEQLNYKKISPSGVKSELIELEKAHPFPKRYSEQQPKIWNYFQKNILEITGYHDRE